MQSVFLTMLAATLASYVAEFNAADEERVTNAVPNSAAAEFLSRNVPLFNCPDADIERAYYFRWWTYRKHLRHDAGRWTVSEFLPEVPWSGPGNTIICAAGHHFLEGRWLRDAVYMSDYIRYWLQDSPPGHRWTFASWPMTGASACAEVSGDRSTLADVLDAAVAWYETWEVGFPRKRRNGGKLRMGGDGKGGFKSIDHYEGTEYSLGGDGWKPLFNSAMWSEAKSIAAVARRAGRPELAERFETKASAVERVIRERLWNRDSGFFFTVDADGKTVPVRELHGYAPWYFGMPLDSSYDVAWRRLGDEKGFLAPWGLTFPERGAPGFKIDYSGHNCQWNGPSWPFATSIALTGYAKYLQADPSRDCALFVRLLRLYAASHVRILPDGKRIAWIDENQNPFTGDWIARTKLLGNPRYHERGRDYNHSTFCDLVISALVGFVPEEDGFSLRPLFPEDWDFLSLENVRFRGRDVSVSWRRETGLRVSVDGREVAWRRRSGYLRVTEKDLNRQ